MNELEVVVSVSGRQTAFTALNEAIAFADAQTQQRQAVFIYARYKPKEGQLTCDNCPLNGTAACRICILTRSVCTVSRRVET